VLLTTEPSVFARTAGITLFLELAAFPLRAQDYSDSTASWNPPRKLFGLNFQMAFPQGQFKHFVGTGYGLGGNFTFFLDRRRRAGLRIFGSWIEYGRTTEHLPLSPTLPGLTVDLTTANDIYSFGAGPELHLGGGPFRPYLHAAIGTSDFATTTSAEGTANTIPFATSTNFNDWTFAWYAGAGVQYVVSHGRKQVSLDLGIRYQGHGETRYLREGSIQPAPGGGVLFRPIQSQTDILVPHFGIQFGF
jgi:opacity protein-like surface antigen